MSLISINTFEHLIENNVVVSYKVIKFCGIPLYSIRIESSNYNWVGQFDADNFIAKTKEDEEHIPLYTETNIGFNSHGKETEETTVQPEGIFREI